MEKRRGNHESKVSTDQAKSPTSQKQNEAMKQDQVKIKEEPKDQDEAMKQGEAKKQDEVRKQREGNKQNEAKKQDQAMKKEEPKEKDEAKMKVEAKKPDEPKKQDEAKKRLLNEFRQIQSNPPEGLTCVPERDNIMVWNAVIFGPDETSLQDGIFKVKLEFSREYPYEPPVVKFLSQMFHPNIDPDTGIIKVILLGDWSPAHRVVDILMNLRLLLVEPNLRCIYVANSEAAQLFKENRRQYNKRARESVQKSWPT